MKMLKMCLNWKVIAGLALVGVAFLVFAPGLAAAALPFLVLAICPISMVFMMKPMNGDMGSGSRSGQACAMSGQKRPEDREARLAQLRAQQQELGSKIAALEADGEHGDSNPGRKPFTGSAISTS